jgi:hypothetical protein
LYRILIHSRPAHRQALHVRELAIMSGVFVSKNETIAVLL